MRVALLGPHPLPRTEGEAPALAGGVDAVVVALANALAECNGVEVTVLTAAPGLASPQEWQTGRYTLHGVPRTCGGRLTGQKAVVSALRSQLEALHPDIVHAHIAGIYARAALAPTTSPQPVVVTLHGIIRREMRQAWPGVGWGTRLRWWLDAQVEAQVVRSAPELIAISPYVINEFRGQTRARFHLVENPVAEPFFEPAEQPSGAERLLCVARVIPRKGITTLIQAFALVARSRPKATLELVGETAADPAYAARCRALSHELGLTEKIRFAGAKSPDEVRLALSGADILVLASEQETAPVSIAEAMARGRAVVTTDVGGCAAMVEDGVTGRVVPPSDPIALAKALSDILAEPGATARMGAAARGEAERRFYPAQVARQTLAVYAEVIGSREAHR